MYSYEERVKYSEVDAGLNMTYFSLVNYLQNCSCFHSDELGYGLEYLGKRHLGWFVTSYEIHINRMPKYAEKVRVCTYPHNMRGMMAKRKYAIETLEGEVLVYADSQWIFMDLINLRPERLPEEIHDAYDNGDPIPEFELEGDKLRVNDLGENVGEFVVTESYIDTNGHMNNSFYIDVTKRFIPDFEIKCVKINYKKAALINDKLRVNLVKLDEGYQVILLVKDEVYTIVEYK